MNRLTTWWRRARRRVGQWLRALGARLLPGYALPVYTTGHVMRYHELMIDVGLADAYDQMYAEGMPQGGAGGNGGPTSAPPQDALGDQAAAATAHRKAHQGGITAAQAQKIRRAFAGELGRLNCILLDIPDSEAQDVPADVTMQALVHFVPVYAEVMTVLIGTGGDTTSA
jgi:hypothetical protein